MIETLILLLLNNIFIIITISLIYFITIKNRTPIQIVKEIVEKKEEKKKAKIQEKVDSINKYNIDNYTGSAEGQKKFD